MITFNQRVFIVSFRFRFCGSVFTDGLKHAADALNLVYEEASWDDPQLQEKISAFKPDLLFVVHGRRFAKRWGSLLEKHRSAVWLVDEPYEVDDTVKWSSCFDTVFVNDPVTISRHRNAHYLPVCFDSAVHKDAGLVREHRVGFVGNYSATRERFLAALAEAGLLSYVVGGPWKTDSVKRLCQSGTVPADQTALLYQKTRIVINVFRETHHYNTQHMRAGSLNPRIYEAVACGAAVITERRSEVESVFPRMIQIATPTMVVAAARRLLSDTEALNRYRADCQSGLSGQSYKDRLVKVLQTTA